MPKPALRSQPAASLSWQQQLAQAIVDPDTLLQALQIPTERFPERRAAADDFRIRVPWSYVRKMRIGDAEDPLLRQVMADGEELLPASGFVTDPVGDLAASAVPGLLHKYAGRVLLITTGACAVHCRYCFRRHFPYADQHAGQQQWSAALDYIRAHQDIREVILSGGDPLVLSDQRLHELFDALQQIPHLQRLRIHSRLPVVLPDRITGALLEMLATSRLQCCLVIHANHANEIGTDDEPRYAELRRAGVTLLNQAVLLRAVNDRPDVQIELSERLFAAGILPYYLHLLDPVRGAAHFHVEDTRAVELLDAMREKLPGYLVPRLVRENAGEKSKTPVFGL